jgi:phosphatidylethanolamine/phosphatidyl-N-methylethanolamine N-methyltransferase
MNHPTVNEESKFWDSFAASYDRFMRRLSDVYSLLIELIWNELKQGDHVLEIATGTGIIALEISRKVKKVTATDISHPMIDIAIEKAKKAGIENIDFSVQSGYVLHFDNQQFDACIVANALHVMKEPEKCLKEIRRVLKTDGLLIAPTFCHGETFKARIISRILEFSGFKAYHKFTIQEFADLVEKSGFRILKKQPLEGPIPLLYLVATPYVANAFNS